jgi:hypothetical protein
MPSCSDRKDGKKPMPPFLKCTVQWVHLCPIPLLPAEPVIRCSGSENQTNCMKTKKGKEGLTRMDNLWRMVL